MAGTIYTINPDIPFVDALARGILTRYGKTPEALSAITLLLPNRRSRRALQEAFLKAGEGKPLLLPAMLGIGDIEEDELGIAYALSNEKALELPPTISNTHRRLLLTELIEAWAKAQREETPSKHIATDQAANLAIELARLLDDVEREGLSFDALKNIVPEALAEHWQITMQFLEILGRQWPNILKDQNRMDAILRRNELLRVQAELWQKHPPKGPVIAAGTTGTMPATQKLLKAIMGMEQGMIILPGLDTKMPEKEWQALPESHPQHGMKHLLEILKISRPQVKHWQEVTEISGRVTLLNETMRPAETTHAWRETKITPAAVEGLRIIEAPTGHSEAMVIALTLREVLEQKDKTACLVTNDRKLAKRVSSLMHLWKVEINDSAGQPLSETPPMVFLRLVAKMVAMRFAPAELLACLKHPFASGGMETAAFRKHVRQLEVKALRGVRPEGGLKIFSEMAEGELANWLKKLGAMADSFSNVMHKEKVLLSEILEAHLSFAEALAATDKETAAERLWSGEEGEAAANFIEELRESADAIAIDPQYYMGMFEALLTGKNYRPRFGTHPRLAILSPMEARLQQFDVMILGGMNQGSWPAENVNPWMSRDMGKTFGLPGEARMQSLSAHDFVMFAAAPEVVITRAEKADGAPTTPSPLLLRLKTVLSGSELLEKVSDVKTLAWAEEMEMPEGNIALLTPPMPKPPVEARPRKLPVTQIEKLMRDPYAVYARRILRLKPLDPIDQDPGGAEFGSIIHEALEGFIKGRGHMMAPDKARELMWQCGEAAFERLKHKPAARALWWPRFEAVAEWFLGKEENQPKHGAEIFAEAEGEWNLALKDAPFTLTAKADRLEVANGNLTVIDYKTGTLPSGTDAVRGYSPQLILEAIIAIKGGFKDVPQVGQVSLLAYWKTSAGGSMGDIKNIPSSSYKKAVEVVLEETEEGLLRLLEFFDARETAYLACPDPAKTPTYNDYEHLERLIEWS